jgi:hypothetical protein
VGVWVGVVWHVHEKRIAAPLFANHGSAARSPPHLCAGLVQVARVVRVVEHVRAGLHLCAPTSDTRHMRWADEEGGPSMRSGVGERNASAPQPNRTAPCRNGRRHAWCNAQSHRNGEESSGCIHTRQHSTPSTRAKQQRTARELAITHAHNSAAPHTPASPTTAPHCTRPLRTQQRRPATQANSPPPPPPSPHLKPVNTPLLASSGNVPVPPPVTDGHGMPAAASAATTSRALSATPATATTHEERGGGRGGRSLSP